MENLTDDIFTQHCQAGEKFPSRAKLIFDALLQTSNYRFAAQSFAANLQVTSPTRVGREMPFSEDFKRGA